MYPHEDMGTLILPVNDKVKGKNQYLTIMSYYYKCFFKDQMSSMMLISVKVKKSITSAEINWNSETGVLWIMYFVAIKYQFKFW